MFLTSWINKFSFMKSRFLNINLHLSGIISLSKDQVTQKSSAEFQSCDTHIPTNPFNTHKGAFIQYRLKTCEETSVREVKYLKTSFFIKLWNRITFWYIILAFIPTNISNEKHWNKLENIEYDRKTLIEIVDFWVK